MRLLNPKQIWAVGGGKGGVGKSFITGNLGAMLAQRGYRVVLVDMDLGGANLHTWLGVNNPDRGVSEFVGHFVENVDQLLIPTGINNLSLISGARDGMEIANLKHTQKLRFLRALQRLEADCVLLDLGAGTAYNTIDFFLLADTHLLLAVPEPTSIENAYRFIKNSFYRKLRSDGNEQGLRDAIEQLLLLNNPQGIRTPKDLIEYMHRQGGTLGRFIERQLEEFQPQLILNQVRNAQDMRIGSAMESACFKYFGIRLKFLGHIEHEDAVWHSVLQRRPLVMDQPNSGISKRLSVICSAILQQRSQRPRTVEHTLAGEP